MIVTDGVAPAVQRCCCASVGTSGESNEARGGSGEQQFGGAVHGEVIHGGREKKRCKGDTLLPSEVKEGVSKRPWVQERGVVGRLRQEYGEEEDEGWSVVRGTRRSVWCAAPSR